MEGKLQFADLEAVGPGTPAGRYLRRFWHPVLRAKDMRPRTARPVEILGEKFTLYRGEGGTSIWFTSVARIAVRSCRSAGSRGTISAAAITAGASTAPANAWSSPTSSSRMRTG